MSETNLQVQITGLDGNAFVIIAKVRKELLRAGHKELAEKFTKEAMKGSYYEMFQTCKKYVEIT